MAEQESRIEPISPEQLANWKEHPVTVIILNLVREEREKLYKILGDGGTLCTDSADSTQAQTSMMIGNIQGLTFLLNIQFEDEANG